MFELVIIFICVSAFFWPVLLRLRAALTGATDVALVAVSSAKAEIMLDVDMEALADADALVEKIMASSKK